MNRAGISNVWHYYGNVFDFSGGRMILRGANGSGKSRAMEMLLPFLLDGDRRRMDSTGSGNVRLEVLMKTGGEGQTNRVGYLWLELEREGDDGREHLTIGAHIKYSTSTNEAKVWYFITPLRVGHDLVLIDDQRQPLKREALAGQIGADNLTDVARIHRERVRAQIFGLNGQSGEERYSGLLQLLHTLRSPDVGNQIDEGNLPSLLSEALPPLSEQALVDAGSRLDALSEARASQQRLDNALERLSGFLLIYRRYISGILSTAADTVQRAASDAMAAGRSAVDCAQERDSLAGQAQAAAVDRDRLDDEVARLNNVINALKQSPAYAAGVNLDNLERRVSALADAASGRMVAAEEARREERDAVNRVDDVAVEITALAAELTTYLTRVRALLQAAEVPNSLVAPAIVAHLIEPRPQEEPVRASLDKDPILVPRPIQRTVKLEPDDHPALIRSLAGAVEGAKARAGLANARKAVASRLLKDQEAITTTQHAADMASELAEQSETEAEEAENTRDAVARTLTKEWRDWTARPDTSTFLGEIEWADTTLRPLILDLDSLIGPGPFDLDLAYLDQVAQSAAEPARGELANRRARLDAADEISRVLRIDLEAEQQRWRTLHEPQTPLAPWAEPLPHHAVPLWRCIDFNDAVGAAERGGLEGALLAAGILTAGVTEDGTLLSAEGQTLLTEASPLASTPISDVLFADPNSPIQSTTVNAVLARIGHGQEGTNTWVAEDGSWGNGPLRGRHTPAQAQHIGASARAAWRERRLAEIDTELANWNNAQLIRDAERRSVRDQETSLSSHIRSAPRSQSLATARGLAHDAARRAQRDRSVSVTKERLAFSLAAEWSKAEAHHKLACDHNSLPYTAERLSEATDQANRAAAECETTQSHLLKLSSSVAAHDRSVLNLVNYRTRRGTAEQSAKQAWDIWRDGEQEFETLTKTRGREATEVRQELRVREHELPEAKGKYLQARENAERLGKDAAVSVTVDGAAAAKAQESESHLRHRLIQLTSKLTLPGIATIGFFVDAEEIVLRCQDVLGVQTTPEVARALANTIRASLHETIPVDETALIRAENTLIRELGASFEVIQSVTNDVHLIELADAEGRLPAATAYVQLESKAKQARDAVSERERTVFTEYVIGGVGEELRRRLRQASELVAAMNNSLGGISTSQGIKVKLHWRPVEDPGTPIARILQLTATSADLRPPHETDELVELLRARVEDAYSTDPTIGYATHLKHALDYRTWHRIEMALTRPELKGGTDVPVTRRSPLSQGERRFVSYVILFAAVDAHLSGLPEADRALRLIILDDAFAKVDNPTIAELMGLLVRLDIDFCMTGHGLWGTFPEVPSLDVYEIRRENDGPAVTTHVHWDGHSRHMRIA